MSFLFRKKKKRSPVRPTSSFLLSNHDPTEPFTAVQLESVEKTLLTAPLDVVGETTVSSQCDSGPAQLFTRDYDPHLWISPTAKSTSICWQLHGAARVLVAASGSTSSAVPEVLLATIAVEVSGLSRLLPEQLSITVSFIPGDSAESRSVEGNESGTSSGRGGEREYLYRDADLWNFLPTLTPRHEQTDSESLLLPLQVHAIAKEFTVTIQCLSFRPAGVDSQRLSLSAHPATSTVLANTRWSLRPRGMVVKKSTVGFLKHHKLLHGDSMFHQSLLHQCQSPTIGTVMTRSIAMRILAQVFLSRSAQEILRLFETVHLSRFLCSMFIDAPFDADTFHLSGELLARASVEARMNPRQTTEESPNFADTLAAKLKHLLPVMSDHCLSEYALRILFELLALSSLSLAPENVLYRQYPKSFVLCGLKTEVHSLSTRLTQRLFKISRKLMESRTKFDALCDAHFSLEGRPYDDALFLSGMSVQRSDVSLSMFDNLSIRGTLSHNIIPFRVRGSNSVSLSDGKVYIKNALKGKLGETTTVSFVVDLRARYLLTGINVYPNMGYVDHLNMTIQTVNHPLETNGRLLCDEQSSYLPLWSANLVNSPVSLVGKQIKYRTERYDDESVVTRYLVISLQFNFPRTPKAKPHVAFQFKGQSSPSYALCQILANRQLHNADAVDAAEARYADCRMVFERERKKLFNLLERVELEGASESIEREIEAAHRTCGQARLLMHSSYLRHAFLFLQTSSDQAALARVMSGLFKQTLSPTRWDCILQHTISLLIRIASMHRLTMRTSKAQRLFRRLCVYGTMSVRERAATWILQLTQSDPDCWSSCFPDIVRMYFSNNAAPLPITDLFSKSTLLTTLGVMINRMDASSVTSLMYQLTSLLEVTTKGQELAFLDVDRVCWILILLSKCIRDNNNIHFGSSCSACNMTPIVGARYRCVNCVNYDLCTGCNAKGVHRSDHVFAKISSPLPLLPTLQEVSSHATGDRPLLPVLYNNPKDSVSAAKRSSENGEDVESSPIMTGALEMVRHEDAQCDRCGVDPIVGVRYRCLNCDDYNLCAACEKCSDHFKHHVFIEIVRPLPPPDTSKLPTAMVPVALHPALYPVLEIPKKVITRKKSRSVLGTGAMNVGTPVRPDAEDRRPRADSAGGTPVRNPRYSLPIMEGEITPHTRMYIASSMPDARGSSEEEDEYDSEADSPARISRASSARTPTRGSPKPPLVRTASTSIPVRTDSVKPAETIFAVAHMLLVKQVPVLQLCMLLVEQLSAYASPSEMVADVFDAPFFNDFVMRTAQLQSLSLRMSVLQMFEAICRRDRYENRQPRSDSTLTCPFVRMQKALFESVRPMFRDTSNAERPISFGLSIIELALSLDSAHEPVMVSLFDEKFVSDLLMVLNIRLTVHTSALWSSIFRILTKCDMRTVVSSPSTSYVFSAFATAATCMEAAQRLVLSDMSDLLRSMLEYARGVPQDFVFNPLLRLVVENLGVSRVTLPILTELITQLSSSLPLHPTEVFSFSTIANLAAEVVTRLPDPNESNRSRHNHLDTMVLLSDMLRAILSKPEARETVERLLTEPVVGHSRVHERISDSLVRWLSHSAWPASSLHVSIQKLISCLGNHSEQTVRCFLRSCSLLVPHTTSPDVVRLCMSFCSTDELAQFFMVELEAFDRILKGTVHEAQAAMIHPSVAKSMSHAIQNMLVQGDKDMHSRQVMTRRSSAIFETKQLSVPATSQLSIPTSSSPWAGLMGSGQSSFMPGAHGFGSASKEVNLEMHQPRSLCPIAITAPEHAVLLKPGVTPTHNLLQTFSSTGEDGNSELKIAVKFKKAAVLEEVHVVLMVGGVVSGTVPSMPSYISVDCGRHKHSISPIARKMVQAHQPSSESTIISERCLVPKGLLCQYVEVRFGKPEWVPTGDEPHGASSDMVSIAISSLDFTGDVVGERDLVFLNPSSNQATQHSLLQLLRRCLMFPETRKNAAASIGKDRHEMFLSLLECITKTNAPIIQDLMEFVAQHNKALHDTLINSILERDASTLQAQVLRRLMLVKGKHSKKHFQRLVSYVFGRIARASDSLKCTPLVDTLCDVIATVRGVAEQNSVSDEMAITLFQRVEKEPPGSMVHDSYLRLLAVTIRRFPNLFPLLMDGFLPSPSEAPASSATGSGGVDEAAQIRTTSPIQESDMRRFAILALTSGITDEACARLLGSDYAKWVVEVFCGCTLIEAEAMVPSVLPFISNISANTVAKDWVAKNVMNRLLELAMSNRARASILALLVQLCNLHPPSQEKVKDMLVGELNRNRDSGALFHSFKDFLQLVFHFKDFVSISACQGTSSWTPDLPVVSRELPSAEWTWKDGPRLATRITRDSTTLVSQSYSVATVMTSQSFPREEVGRCTITVEHVPASQIISVGMISDESTYNVRDVVGDVAGTLGFSLGCGTVYMDGKSYFYGHFTPVRSGDKITLEYDPLAHTARYYVNSRSLGPVPVTIPDHQWHPAVTTFCPDVRIRISPGAEPQRERPFLQAATQKHAEHLVAHPTQYYRSNSLLHADSGQTMGEVAHSLREQTESGPSAELQLFYEHEELSPDITIGELVRSKKIRGEVLDLKYRFVHGGMVDRHAAKVTCEVLEARCPYKVFLMLGRDGVLESVLRDVLDEVSGEEGVTSETLVWIQGLEFTLALLRVPGGCEAIASCDDSRNCLLDLVHEVYQHNIPSSESNSLSAAEKLEKTLVPLQKALANLLRESCSKPLKEAVAGGPQGCLVQLLDLVHELSSFAHNSPELFETPTALARAALAAQSSGTNQHMASMRDWVSSSSYWAGGTGFGYGSTNSVNFDHAKLAHEKNVKARHLNSVLECICAFLECKCGEDGTAAIRNLIGSSCLLPMIEGHLRNDSIMDMVDHTGLYRAVFSLTCSMAKNAALVQLLAPTPSGDAVGAPRSPREVCTILVLLDGLRGMSHMLESTARKISSNVGAGVDPANVFELVELIYHSYDVVEEAVVQHLAKSANSKHGASPRASAEKASKDGGSESKSRRRRKKAKAKNKMTYSDLAEYQYDEAPLLSDAHHYRERSTQDGPGGQTKMMRLMGELPGLSTNLPLHESSSIFLRVDKDRLDVMSAVITGPQGTPYEGGVFLFHIYLPPNYPSVPPCFNLATTGRGTVRFNPNLYNCGKVCLSLLGTWSGDANEQWNEKTSTLLQVLVSIQSLILVDQPYFNEPGYQVDMNTPQGDEWSRAYNANIREQTIRFAMIEQLRCQPLGFESVVKGHFRCRRDAVLETVQRWVEESDKAAKPRMEALLGELRELLLKL